MAAAVEGMGAIMTGVTRQVAGELNLDPAERDKFEQLAARWWDVEGEFKPLHDLNPARLAYVAGRAVLSEQDVLDIGCGGGILSESLAAAGGRVCAIDVAEKALQVARLHLFESRLTVDYQAITAEQLAIQKPAFFNVITCMEMLEHVPEPWSVVQACAQLLPVGGQVFFSTINRTPRAFALAVVGAEYVFNLLPRGTHEYRRFIRPSELASWCRDAGLRVRDIRGLHYNPLTRHAHTGGHVAVNYLLHAEKPVV